MKQRFIIATYDTEIVGSVPFREGMLEVAYYMGRRTFGFRKSSAMLFGTYEGAEAAIEQHQINYSQIEKIFIK